MADPHDLVLGIDSSTQGTTAVALHKSSFEVVARYARSYRQDSRLSSYLPQGAAVPLLPPREPGEADQHPSMYLAALDAVFEDLGTDILRRVAAVNVSAQQHGQVGITQQGVEAIAGLQAACTALSSFPSAGYASGRAPTWMTSSTAAEAEEIRRRCGGTDAALERCGCTLPLRFTAAVLRRIALRDPHQYQRTRRIHLISSFLGAVLRGDPNAPADWGNGGGTGMMNWSDRTWDRSMVKAVASDLPEGAEGLLARLTPIVHPLLVLGRIAPGIARRFGFHPDCVVIAGSGDNPQSKVLAPADLISLGTSFVTMTEGAAPHRMANFMYDGLGRPFLFGCRTNGALAWEALRLRYGLRGDDFNASDRALERHAPGAAPLCILQPQRESFPESPPLDLPAGGGFEEVYAGVVDSSLALLYLGARAFSRGAGPVSVTGGATASRQVLQRVAAIWGRPVVRLADAGAATGAAVAAAVALAGAQDREDVMRRAQNSVRDTGQPLLPDPRWTAELRGPGGYFERLARNLASVGGCRLDHSA